MISQCRLEASLRTGDTNRSHPNSDVKSTPNPLMTAAAEHRMVRRTIVSPDGTTRADERRARSGRARPYVARAGSMRPDRPTVRAQVPPRKSPVWAGGGFSRACGIRRRCRGLCGVGGTDALRGAPRGPSRAPRNRRSTSGACCRARRPSLPSRAADTGGPALTVNKPNHASHTAAEDAPRPVPRPPRHVRRRVPTRRSDRAAHVTHHPVALARPRFAVGRRADRPSAALPRGPAGCSRTSRVAAPGTRSFRIPATTRT